MACINKLKAKLVEHGIGVVEFAAEIGIDSSTLYRKLRKPDTFQLWELQRIKEILHLTPTQFSQIFLEREHPKRRDAR